MQYDPTNPLIVQGDRTVLVEVDNPHYAEARDALAPFAELEKSPEHIHTYRLTPLSLWNAAAAGHDRRGDGRRARHATASSRCRPTCRPTSPSWSAATAGSGSNGTTRTAPARLPRPAAARGAGPAAEGPRLPRRPARRDQLRDRPRLPRRPQAGADRRRLPGRGPGRLHRGRRPADRPARRSRRSGLPFTVRDYQREAADIFYAGGDVRGGSGVIVLPCGAGKTIVGIAAMAAAAEDRRSS